MNLIAPDLQAAVFCEDVRAEISGQQTLVGVSGVIPAHALPIGFFKLCLLDALVRRGRTVCREIAHPSLRRRAPHHPK